MSVNPANYRPEDPAGQRGFNLVEVIIAMALLGTVLLGIISLFYFGRSNVYSGKQMTHAVAIGTQVLEDLSPLTMAQVESAFGFTLGTTAVTTNTINGVSYPNSILRSTDNVTLDADPPNFLDTWLADLDGRLPGSAVDVVFTPTLANRLLQIKVIVSWQEGTRGTLGIPRRQIMMETVKIRPN
ncbi:MAG TPA: prepilin-type N-terminal cleavage/methylation domain-containing protein [Thermoanaerobaculia bacterium]|nr:prepilin-type N-terminal cleavage/methylation domain-containing protein [Thermoanaerobaculia bacterium]